MRGSNEKTSSFDSSQFNKSVADSRVPGRLCFAVSSEKFAVVQVATNPNSTHSTTSSSVVSTETFVEKIGSELR
jgi:hypothetical protein